MIFLHRLGIVLYLVGFGFAILFAIVSLLIALNGLFSGGGAISGAWVYAVLSVVCWLWGRAMKYILTDMQFPPPGRARAEGEERELNPLDWKRQHQVAELRFAQWEQSPAFSLLGWTRRSVSYLLTLFPVNGPTRQMFSCFGYRMSGCIGRGR